jgi:lysophospholipase L1-like esterase
MGHMSLLLFVGLTAFGQPPAYRVAFIGTSITCGAGATERFLPLVTNGLKKRLGRRVQTYDLCFGGAHSFTHLLLLQQTALPWKPDLVIVETGALDGFAPELSLPAIEQIFHALAAARVPAVFLTRIAKCSDEKTRPVVMRLAREYGFPVADIPAQVLPDGCHPTNAGHAQIAASLLRAALDANQPKPPARPARLPGAEFVAAASARESGPAAEAPLAFFKNTGAALRAPAGTVEWALRFQGVLAGVLFRLGHTPAAMEYHIDRGPWRKVVIQPTWFLNYYLETDLKPGPHTLWVRLQAGPAGVILDGLEQITPTRP